MPTLPRSLRELRYEGEPLTPGQQRVLRHVAMGRTGPQTAEELGVSIDTVKDQLAIARAKLGANTTTHAVAIAVSLDIV